MGCLYSLNDVYSHLLKIKFFCNKINKISVITRMFFFPCDGGYIFYICFLGDYSCIWTLYWVRIPVRVPLRIRKRKLFYIFVWPRWWHEYSFVQLPPHPTWGRRLPHSRNSLASPIGSKYGVRQKNHTYLCFACKVPKFRFDKAMIYDWIQLHAICSALTCVGVLFSEKLIKSNQ